MSTPMVYSLACKRCENIWNPRVEKPTVCPKCHSPYWNKPRREPSENSGFPYPLEFNSALKQQIKTRDNHTCQLCGTHRELGVHHINYLKIDLVLSNLITLCNSCNVKVNSQRKHWVAHFQEVMKNEV